MTDRRFRVIVIAYVVSIFVAVFAGLMQAGYTPELRAAYAAEPFWLANVSLAILVPLLILAAVISITGIVGLFLFKPWGRSLSLWLTIVGTPLTAIAGPTLASGFESAAWEASTLLWGAILALAYFSPVADRFLSHGSLGPKPSTDSV